jgi:hypothetical protein
VHSPENLLGTSWERNYETPSFRCATSRKARCPEFALCPPGANSSSTQPEDQRHTTRPFRRCTRVSLEVGRGQCQYVARAE